MRSKQISTAIAQGHNRFEICQKVGKAVRITHRDGTRLQDSINRVLEQLSAETVIPQWSFRTVPNEHTA